MAETLTYQFNGHDVVVIRPENPNGKWIWKTEFLHAFDQAEAKLLELGYTRVYYQISDRYGDYKAIRLMHHFYEHVTEKFGLDKKCFLFGFSRGGLYAFNYTLFYPETVSGVYLDAPVLDLTTWPRKDAVGTEMRTCYDQMLDCYTLCDETVAKFNDSPIRNLEEFFKLEIPLLLVAGDSDQVVDFEKNSNTLIRYCRDNGIPLEYYVKPGCKHHPHSLDDVTPIIRFVAGSENEGK